jgi:hypothetical protein
MRIGTAIKGLALLGGTGILVFAYTFSCSTANSKSLIVTTQSAQGPTQPKDLTEVRPIEMPLDTMSKLLAKGLPPASPPRRKVFEQTAKQSTKEVVRDLGSFFALANCCNRDTGYGVEDIARWAVTIPPNVKVARLIEEGRKSPDEISSLLRAEIAHVLQDYEKKRDARDVRFRSYLQGLTPGPSIKENDDLYEKTRCYSDALYEYERIHYLVYSGFYVLVNIERMDEPLLRHWLSLHKAKGTECPAMDAWLVTTLHKTPATALENVKAPRINKTKISVWNAPWSHNDQMLLMADVDSIDLPSIEVLEIPREPFANDVIHRILDEFMTTSSQSLAPTQ